MLYHLHMCHIKFILVRIFRHLDTVNLVYKDHPRDQQYMVLIYRWPLYAGSITWKGYPWGPVQWGLYKQVVFMYR